MADTRIEWADRVWNPVTGCTKISEGCKNCYAERMAKRLAGRCGYPKENPFAVTMHLEKLDLPRRWRKPCRVFVNSMGDLFHEDVDGDMLQAIFLEMLHNTRHTFMILTKRPERMKNFVNNFIQEYSHVMDEPMAALRPHIWLGVTAENQEEADRRIPILLQIPAAVRFVSCEPLLEHVNLMPWMRCPACSYTEADKRYHMDHRYCKNPGWNGLDWVIAGGETGPGARPCYVEWIGSLWQQCQNSQTPFFFKQWAGKVETVYPPELVEIQNTRQFPEVPA